MQLSPNPLILGCIDSSSKGLLRCLSETVINVSPVVLGSQQQLL